MWNFKLTLRRNPIRTELTEHLQNDVLTENSRTEQEEYFLQVLFSIHKGDVPRAMETAGYPKDMNPNVLRRKFKEAIIEETKTYLATASAEAALSLISVLRDPNALGAKNIIAASKEILDRGGITRPEEVHIVADNVMIMLPPKLPKETDFIIDHIQDWGRHRLPLRTG